MDREMIYRKAFYDYLNRFFPEGCVSPTFWDCVKAIRELNWME